MSIQVKSAEPLNSTHNNFDIIQSITYLKAFWFCPHIAIVSGNGRFGYTARSKKLFVYIILPAHDDLFKLNITENFQLFWNTSVILLTTQTECNPTKAFSKLRCSTFHNAMIQTIEEKEEIENGDSEVMHLWQVLPTLEV